MAKTIHEEFMKTLTNVTWMDQETKTAAIEKANAMRFNIAYPDELIDNNTLEEYYDGLELQSDALLQNVLRINKFNKKHVNRRLSEFVTRGDWEDFSSRITKVDAFYSILENNIRMFLYENSKIGSTIVGVFELCFISRISSRYSARSLFLS